MKKLLTAAAILVAAAAPAYSGPKGDNENELRKQEEAIQKRDNKDVDKAYSDMLKHTRTGAKPYDPWGSVRPADKK